jgi:hypothetical protein
MNGVTISRLCSVDWSSFGDIRTNENRIWTDVRVARIGGNDAFTWWLILSRYYEHDNHWQQTWFCGFETRFTLFIFDTRYKHDPAISRFDWHFTGTTKARLQKPICLGDTIQLTLFFYFAATWPYAILTNNGWFSNWSPKNIGRVDNACISTIETKLPDHPMNQTEQESNLKESTCSRTVSWASMKSRYNLVERRLQYLSALAWRANAWTKASPQARFLLRIWLACRFLSAAVVSWLLIRSIPASLNASHISVNNAYLQ